MEHSEKILRVSEADDDTPKELPANTFEMRPNPRNAFKSARVKEIVNDVLNETLQGKTLDNLLKSQHSRNNLLPIPTQANYMRPPKWPTGCATFPMR